MWSIKVQLTLLKATVVDVDVNVVLVLLVLVVVNVVVVVLLVVADHITFSCGEAKSWGRHLSRPRRPLTRGWSPTKREGVLGSKNKNSN